MGIFEVSSDAVDEIVALQPTVGTSLGIGERHGEWDDLSPAGVRAERALARKAGRLAGYPSGNGAKGILVGTGLALLAFVAIFAGIGASLRLHGKQQARKDNESAEKNASKASHK